MTRRTMLGGMVLAAFAGAAMFAGPAAAREGKEGKEGKEVEGKVTAVDATAGTITIANRKGTTTLTIPAAATIARNHKTATLADFLVGDHAEANLDATGVVTRLRGRGKAAVPVPPTPL